MDSTLKTIRSTAIVLAIALMSWVMFSCEKEFNEEPNINITTPDSTGGELDTDSSGTFNGAYNLQGTFTVDETGININSDYQGTSAPGPVWYLSNNERSISGGLELGNSQKSGGAHKINTDKVADYDYLIMWCKPFSVFIGNGKIPKKN